MIRRPPRSTLSSSSAASDVYKRQSVLYCNLCANATLSEQLWYFCACKPWVIQFFAWKMDAVRGTQGCRVHKLLFYTIHSQCQQCAERIQYSIDTLHQLIKHTALVAAAAVIKFPARHRGANEGYGQSPSTFPQTFCPAYRYFNVQVLVSDINFTSSWVTNRVSNCVSLK